MPLSHRNRPLTACFREEAVVPTQEAIPLGAMKTSGISPREKLKDLPVQ
jgi:hypothetical protein